MAMTRKGAIAMKSTFGQKGIADGARKRDVNNSSRVHVANFGTLKSEFRASGAMRVT